MSTSSRHHYIPQFYLKGFFNETNEYYVFDKQTEKIRKKYPSTSFYAYDRNTATINEEKITILEDIYTYFENQTAPHLHQVINSKNGEDLTPEGLIRLIRFIALMYWRVPDIDEKIEKVIDEQTFSDSGFDIIDDTTGESVATKEFQEQLKNNSLFRQMYRIFLPLLSSKSKYKKTNFDDWRIYTRGNNCQLTGDNPLILENFVDFGSLNEELIFPLSRNKILVNTKRPKPTNLSSTFNLKLDMLILQNATRYVCCSERKYLEILVNDLYSYSKNYDFKEQMTKDLFNNFI